MTSQSQKSNRLSQEKSPYLLQHAQNPVNWYPWGKEAFEKARSEEKPIFLSIGYSTCHWCHVMEEESFVNTEIAQLLNDSFVSIKVDREERPDVDHVYMQAVTAMTGSGGWPMSVFLTPDLKPFYGGTYFPPQDKWGRPGFTTVLNALKEKWRTERDHIIRAGTELAEALKENSNRQNKPKQEIGVVALEVAMQEFEASFDPEFGGFGPAPKFPRTHTLSFLLRYFKRFGGTKALPLVERTLECISKGGINDHLGGGFHRYSTDRIWQVPHFEKMLYDQAILSKTFVEAFQITKKEEYAKETRRIFDYVLRDMTDKTGAFYSAEDADSLVSRDAGAKKSEGAFYIWGADEINQLLGENAEIFNYYYGVQPNGNAVEDPHGEFKGKNILICAHSIQETAEKFGKSVSEIETSLKNSEAILFKVREKRPKPHLDDKTLTDWNALMISSLACGARALKDPKYKNAAVKATDFILNTLKRKDGRLMHRFRSGEVAITGFLDDYAFFIQALIHLYETTFEAQYLKEALYFSNEMIRLFWDEVSGGFRSVGSDAETLIAESKELYDGAIPSGNSMATIALLRAGRISGNQKLEEIARKNLEVFSAELTQYPSGFALMLAALDFSIGPVKEIVIHGKKTVETDAILLELSNYFLPNSVLIWDQLEGENSKLIRELAPFIKNQTPAQGKTTVFVCENYTCQLPVTEVLKLRELIQDKK